MRDITRATAVAQFYANVRASLFYFIPIYGANEVTTALTPLFNLIQKSGSGGKVPVEKIATLEDECRVFLP